MGVGRGRNVCRTGAKPKADAKDHPTVFRHIREFNAADQKPAASQGTACRQEASEASAGLGSQGKCGIRKPEPKQGRDFGRKMARDWTRMLTTDEHGCSTQKETKETKSQLLAGKWGQKDGRRWTLINTNFNH